MRSAALVQDAEQIVEVITVVLFLSRGLLGGGLCVKRLGKDGVGHDRFDVLLRGGCALCGLGNLGLDGSLNRLDGRGRSTGTLGIDMGLDGLVDTRYSDSTYSINFINVARSYRSSFICKLPNLQN